MNVNKEINGQTVTARPVFKGDAVPAYWVGAVNDRTLPRRFPSPREIFRFVERSRRG